MTEAEIGREDGNSNNLLEKEIAKHYHRTNQEKEDEHVYIDPVE